MSKTMTKVITITAAIMAGGVIMWILSFSVPASRRTAPTAVVVTEDAVLQIDSIRCHTDSIFSTRHGYRITDTEYGIVCYVTGFSQASYECLYIRERAE